MDLPPSRMNQTPTTTTVGLAYDFKLMARLPTSTPFPPDSVLLLLFFPRVGKWMLWEATQREHIGIQEKVLLSPFFVATLLPQACQLESSNSNQFICDTPSANKDNVPSPSSECTLNKLVWNTYKCSIRGNVLEISVARLYLFDVLFDLIWLFHSIFYFGISFSLGNLPTTFSSPELYLFDYYTCLELILWIHLSSLLILSFTGHSVDCIHFHLMVSPLPSSVGG